MKLKEFIDSNNCLTNMNEYVKKNEITNYGFEEEIKKLIKGLSRMKKPNILILGKAGVGKTALVEKLCEMINKNEVPKSLQNKKIIELSLGGAVAGTRYRGDFEEKINEILKYVRKRRDIILFIDEIHNILDAGGAEGAVAAGDILKPFLARGDIHVIGATTINEYKRSIKKDDAMNRRFSQLCIKEPDTITTINILRGMKDKYQDFYNISLSDNEIINAVFHSKLKKGNFPDKAFDCLESYCYEKGVNYE